MRPVLCYIVGICIAIRAWKQSDPKSKMTVRISVKESHNRLSWVITNSYVSEVDHVTCMPINIFLNAIIRHVNPYSVRLVKLLTYDLI